jgi:fatty-acyl-CoA synthase
MNTRLLSPTPSAYAYPLLIKSLLLSAHRYTPDREIVYGDQFRYTYKDFVQRVHKLANVLTQNGVGPGDTVAVMDWDSHRYLEAYFAVPMIGAVLHHINVRLSPDQILYTMNHAEDKVVLIHDDFLPIAEGIGPHLTTVQHYIQLTDNAQAAETSVKTVGEYEALIQAASDSYDFPDFDENSVATTFYTTGTTGNPKGVCFSHRQLVLHTLTTSLQQSAFAGMDLLKSDDVYMPMTPMFHVHAWGIPYVATMLGVKQVYPGRYEPNKLVRLYRDEGVTFSHGVPAVLQMVLTCDEAKDTDMRGWKMLTGGSAPTQGLAAEMARRGIRLHTAYGMSETCPLLTAVYLSEETLRRPLEEQVSERIRTGVASTLVDLRVVDPDMNDVAHDGEAVGEIVVRTPWVTQTYHKEPEKSEALWEGGWLHTGDVATIDVKGVVQIKDRIKDVIKTGGEWISSLELESLISQHKGVQEVAVVGVPDEKWDERPMAMVVLADGSDAAVEDLKAHLQQFVENGRINKWAIPDDIRLVDAIPKTSVGKIDKKLIRAGL